MRTGNLLAITALLWVLGANVSAEDLWYDSYESAIKAFHAGDWNKAEARLKDALKAQPTQGKRIKAYGTRFIRYLPDYYLGLVFLKQGRYQEALNQLERVKVAKLVEPGEAEYQELTQAIRMAEERLTPLPSPRETAPNRQEDATVQVQKLSEQITRMEAESRARREEDRKKEEHQIARQQFNDLLQKASRAVTAGNYPQARNFTREASELGIDREKTEELMRWIESFEKEEAERNQSAAREIDPEDVRALEAFYSGDYERAISLLEPLAARKSDSARVHFYLGCSYAALGLIQGKKGLSFLEKSRALFARSRGLNPALQYDSRYISPRILRIYKQQP